MNYYDIFLGFVAESLINFTNRFNNTSVTNMFPGLFSISAETIWSVWMSNLSEVPLPVWIVAYIYILIRVNYLRYVDENEWYESSNIRMLHYKGISKILIGTPLSRSHLLTPPVVKGVLNYIYF